MYDIRMDGWFFSVVNEIEYKERAVLKLVKQGDPSFKEALYCMYAGYLTGVCTRYIPSDQDAKDVLHDSFIKIFENIQSFSYSGPGSLKAWLSKIVINISLNFLRRDRKLLFLTPEDSEIEMEDYEEPELSGIPLEELHRLIRDLPPGYRTIFNLYVIEGKSHKEIAKNLNIRETTSASQFHRAKTLLAKRILKYQSDHSKDYER